MKTVARPPQDMHVPWATLVKLFAAVVAAWAIVHLWPSVQLFLISVLVAVALSPVLDGLERRGFAHGRAVSLAGGTLGGVIGAVLALPIVAAYPVFEKHWLDDYLNPDAVEDHRALRDMNGKEGEAVVDAVLHGAAPHK